MIKIGLFLMSFFFLIACNQNEVITNKSTEITAPLYTPLELGSNAFYITTKDGALVTNKETYIESDLVIRDKDFNFVEDIELKIRGRGNSTWKMPKKPYRLKLNNKHSLFEMPSNKDWALLANHADKTLTRNILAFKLGNILVSGWTPKSVDVELFLNSEYKGSYQLVESIKVGSSRVDIVDGEDDSDLAPSEVGYLLEIDQRRDEDYCFHTSIKKIPICLKSPDDAITARRDYIRNYINDFEDVLFGEEFIDSEIGYQSLIDVDSFINYYLVQEIAKNLDAKNTASIYLHKNANGKLVMGPLWDFDLAFGNTLISIPRNPHGVWIAQGPWYARLFQDPQFRALVKARWDEKKAEIRSMVNLTIDQRVSEFEQAQTNNFLRWPILSKDVWPSPLILGSHKAEMDHLKKWTNDRLDWLDEHFEEL